MSDAIPFDAYYDLSLPSAVALSPDGERAAFVAQEFDGEEDEARSSLFVVPTDGSESPHRLTRASDASSPKWSPDGSKLGFVGAREDDVELGLGQPEEEDEDGEQDDGPSLGSEEPKPQLWVFNLERGGDARQLTDREEGIREFDWAPDGERVVASARDPTDEEAEYLQRRREEDGPIETERLQHKLDSVGWQDPVTSYLFVGGLEDRELERLDEAYGGGAFEGLTGLQPRWGEAGIAFLSNRTERPDDSMAMDLYLVQPDGSDLERLTAGDVTAAGPEWAPDGERLAFIARDPEIPAAPAEVYLWDGTEYTSLSSELDRTVAREGRIRWTGDGNLLVDIADEAQTKLFKVDPDGGAAETFAAQGDERGVAAFDLRDGTVAVLLTHPKEGLDLYAVDETDLDDAGADPTRLTDRNAAFRADHAMPAVQRVEFESDGRSLNGVLYTPSDADLDADDPRPLVLSIHGGPVSYDEPEFKFEYAAWVSRGYLVFCPNYRGGSSYGREFTEQLVGQWGTVEVDDIVAGVESLVDRDWVDPDRVFGRGFSYGGIAQGYLVTQSDLLTAAAPEHGIYDLRSDFGTGDSHNWMERDFGLPWEEPETFEAHSSITDIDGIDTPMLITAGGQDWRCPPSQSEQLYNAAKKQDVEAKLVVYPEEHHNVGAPDRAVHRLEELEAWYETHDPAVEEPAGD